MTFYYHLEADTPTHLSAELISSTTVRISWTPPSNGGTVAGYMVRYIDNTGEEVTVTFSASTLSAHINCNSENITVHALSQHLPSTSVTVDITFRKLKFT